MARKVFVSYKYSDPLVQNMGLWARGTCRDYVDVVAQLLEDIHIYKGEEDGIDLSNFKRDTIESHLKEKIRDSSVTAVLVSKGMKTLAVEADQWIPWEVSYSLREHAREDRVSRANGVLAVIIPDEYGRYDYYFQPSGCVRCNVVTHRTDQLFEILRNNMFNKTSPFIQSCLSQVHNTTYHVGSDHSYIPQVKWSDFILNPDYYISLAINLRDRISEFNVQKVVQKVLPTIPTTYGPSLQDILSLPSYS